MSEHQYYEFRALDRQLTDEEMRALRRISTRAKITPTSFVNVYNYGDFAGDPAELMNRYFDMHVYAANWGTHGLMLRFPSSLLPLEIARAYAPEDPVRSWFHGEHTIIEVITFADDYLGPWDDGPGWIDRLRPVRDELMQGDLRPLYLCWLIWLYNVVIDDVEDTTVEPPVPDGLGQLSPAQEALVEFLRIDHDLLAVAAECSEPLTLAAAPSETDMRAWLAGLPEQQKDDLLLDALTGGDPFFGERLRRMYLESAAVQRQSATGGSQPRRTAGEMIARWQIVAAERERAEAERAEREHAAQMEDIASRTGEMWREADTLAEQRHPRSYDEAIAIVDQLHAAAKHFGTLDEFEQRRAELRAKHSRKISFKRMLDEVDKPKPAWMTNGAWEPDRS